MSAVKEQQAQVRKTEDLFDVHCPHTMHIFAESAEDA